MNKYYKIAIVSLVAFLLMAGFFFWRKHDWIKEKKVEIQIQNELIEEVSKKEAEKKIGSGAEEKKGKTIEQESALPKKIFFEVPFSVQAPLGEWDIYHEEACEETSLLMVKYFFDKKELSPELAEKEIQAMIAYEKKHFGYFEDTDAQKTAQLGREFYGMENQKVVYDFSLDDLKKYLAEGNPVIVPAAGRLLGNPFFTSPGPLYHNLVLVGYEGDKIITNDPGTKRGRNYAYEADILYAAIHDFPGKPEDIEKGKKAMIIFD